MVLTAEPVVLAGHELVALVVPVSEAAPVQFLKVVGLTALAGHELAGAEPLAPAHAWVGEQTSLPPSMAGHPACKTSHQGDSGSHTSDRVGHWLHLPKLLAQ